MKSINAKSIAESLFSHEIFKDIETAALVRKYDITGDIHDRKQPIRAQIKPQPQTDLVISAIPPQGIIIQKPGAYRFAGDLTWSPTSPGAAIILAAPNTTLDMGGFTLTASVPKISQQYVGIYLIGASGLGPPLPDVAVRNGTLANFSFYGVEAEAVVGLIIDNVTVTGISYHNLTDRNACPAGIHVTETMKFSITNCTVQGLQTTSDSSAGIQLVNSGTGTVTGCKVQGLLNNDGSAQGYSYIGCFNVVTSNCTAADLITHWHGNTETIGHTAIGYCPIFCNALTYNDCFAANIFGCCDDAHGFSVFLDLAVTVNGFTATNIQDGVAPYNTGAKATGLEVYGVNVSINNCSVNQIVATNPQDKQATGFSAWGAAISFTGCKASNVEVWDEKHERQFWLGRGTGFGWAPDPRPEFCHVGAYFVTYADCHASTCMVGFDTWYHVNSLWTGIDAKDCDIFILADPAETRTLTGDACSECKPPISVTLTNIAAHNVYPGS